MIARRRPKFSRLLVLAALVPVVLSLVIESPIPVTTRALAGILWILCLAPAIHYSSLSATSRRPLPFLPSIGIAFGLYFVLPVALGAYNHYYRVEVNPVTDYDVPVQLALFGWVMMLSAYVVAGAFRMKPPRARRVSWDEVDLGAWGLALLYAPIGINTIQAVFGLTLASPAIMQFVLSLQWLGIAFLTVAARNRVLGKLQVVMFALGAAVTVSFMVGRGSLAPVVQLAVVVAYALWLSGVRIRARWIALGASIFVFAITARGVAIDFRMQAWIGRLNLSPVERTGLMLRLISNKIDNEGLVATVVSGANSTFERSANMDLFADVVRRTPSEIQYWNGFTYASLVGSFVPRMLWPDKPTKEIGQAFGHRYSYLYYTNLTTAINLPFFVEFYANFGVVGVLIGMLVVGFLYRILNELVNSPGQDTLTSLIGVIVLVPLLMIETDFSLTFGGLVLNGLVLYTLMTFIRRNSARIAPTPAPEPRYTVVVNTARFGAPMIHIEPMNPRLDK